METVTEAAGRKKLKTNAVGFTYESRDTPGLFSEVYFYNSDMAHEEDGKVRQNIFYQPYWARGHEEHSQWKMAESKRSSRFKVMPSRRMQKRRRRENEGEEEEEEQAFDARAFLQDEAQEAAASESEEELEEDDDDDGEDVEGRAGPRRWQWGDNLLSDRGEEAEEEEENCGEQSDTDEPFDVFEEAVTDSDEEGCDQTAMEKFMQWVLDPRFHGYSIVAHFGSRFDSHFVLRWLNRRGVHVKPVFDGNTLLLIEIPKLRLRFIDSYKFVKIGLAKFRKRFPDLKTVAPPDSLDSDELEALEAEIEEGGDAEKGCFPFRANTEQWYEYEGPLPAREYFVEAFSSEASVARYEAFSSAWPEHKQWNFKAEMHKYLRQDVRILRGGCLLMVKEFFAFQADLLSDFTEDELKERYKDVKAGLGAMFHPLCPPYFTKPSYVHHLWIFFAMEEGQMYLVSNQTGARKTSRDEIEYLSFLESQGKQIKHAFNTPSGQMKIGPYYVDGYCYEDDQHTAYEYLGCAVHFHKQEDEQCPISGMFTKEQSNPFGVNNERAYQQWKRKKEYLQQLGVNVCYIWECQYQKLRQAHPTLKHFSENVYQRPAERLAPRKALFGGRTETFRFLFHEAEMRDRELKYADKNR